METKKLQALRFEIDNDDYTLDFGIEQVKSLAQFSRNKKGNVTSSDLIKFALKKDDKVGFITDKKAKDITHALIGGVEWGDDFMEFEEIIEYIVGLFAQAINEESEKHTPAIIHINDDNTVNITVDGVEHKLKYLRRDLEEMYTNDLSGSASILENYLVGTALIHTGLLHTKKNPSAGLKDSIFMSAWATMNHEETKHDFENMINALVVHAQDVLEDGVKKSNAVIKMKTKI